MSYRKFLDEVKRGLPERVYVFSAADQFLQSEAISLLRRLVPMEEREFSFHSFDLGAAEAERLPFEQILDVLNTASFFTGRKIVVTENLQKLPKKDFPRLKRYLADPAEGSLLALFHSGSEKKELREAMKGIRQFSLDIREKDIPAWLREKAKMKGVGLDSAAAEYLVNVIGPDLGMLSSEIDKLSLVGKDRVGVDDVRDIIEGKRSFSAFDLVAALRARDPEKAFRIYRVLRETEEPYSLLGVLNWQFARGTADSKGKEARDYALRVFSLLHEADVSVKTSGSQYPMELLLVRLLQISRGR